MHFYIIILNQTKLVSAKHVIENGVLSHYNYFVITSLYCAERPL